LKQWFLASNKEEKEMVIPKSVVAYKKAEEMLVAGLCFQMQERKDILIKCKKLSQDLADKICGPPFAIFHWNKGIRNGLFVEAGFPVTQPIETDGISCRTLKEEDVLTIFHTGSFERLKKAYREILDWIEEREIAIQAISREIYHEFNTNNPENDVTEVQIFLRNWNNDFARISEHIPSKAVPEKVMQGFEEMTADCCSGKAETIAFYPLDCI
jgi:effector-binding domain-containing protein